MSTESGSVHSGLGSVTGGATPPGLQNKATPPGLKMQNKTPYGWSQGQKEGWKNNYHKHKHPINTEKVTNH